MYVLYNCRQQSYIRWSTLKQGTRSVLIQEYEKLSIDYEIVE